MSYENKQPLILNLGSENLTTINELALMIAKVSNKKIKIKNNSYQPEGIIRRSSNNNFIKKTLNWEPILNLEGGLKTTYLWVKNILEKFGRGLLE